eukprot:2100797-Prymnesium_polylepis.1
MSGEAHRLVSLKLFAKSNLGAEVPADRSVRSSGCAWLSSRVSRMSSRVSQMSSTPGPTMEMGTPQAEVERWAKSLRVADAVPVSEVRTAEGVSDSFCFWGSVWSTFVSNSVRIGEAQLSTVLCTAVQLYGRPYPPSGNRHPWVDSSEGGIGPVPVR